MKVLKRKRMCLMQHHHRGICPVRQETSCDILRECVFLETIVQIWLLYSFSTQNRMKSFLLTSCVLTFLLSLGSCHYCSAGFLSKHKSPQCGHADTVEQNNEKRVLDCMVHFPTAADLSLSGHKVVPACQCETLLKLAFPHDQAWWLQFQRVAREGQQGRMRSQTDKAV